MAIPTSGPIKFSDLQDEFGGTYPISMSEYYRAGEYVDDTYVNNNVPDKGEIHLSDFKGTRDGAPFNVSYLGSAAASTTSYFTPTITDSHCTIVVVQQRSSGGTGLQPGAAAIIGGTAGQLFAAYKSTAFDDGVAFTITTKLVTDGTTQSVSCPNADGGVYVFQYVGVIDFAAAEVSRDAVYNTDGGNHGVARSYVEVDAVAARDCVFFLGISKGGHSGDPTGKLDVYPGSGISIGFDINPVTGLNRYNFAVTPRMILAFAMKKEIV